LCLCDFGNGASWLTARCFPALFKISGGGSGRGFGLMGLAVVEMQSISAIAVAFNTFPILSSASVRGSLLYFQGEKIAEN
jgi:hypothetical protein